MKTFDSESKVPTREKLFVGVSESRIATEGETLVAYGIGACLGIGMYDPGADVAGLAYALLPRADEGQDHTDAKFVDSGIESLFRAMISAGSGYTSVEAYLVGGSRIFDLPNLASGVGERSVTVAREELDRLNVPIQGEAVGGSSGRTVEFDSETGEFHVYTADDDEPVTL